MGPWPRLAQERKYQTSKRFIIFIGTKGPNNSQFRPEMWLKHIQTFGHEYYDASYTSRPTIVESRKRSRLAIICSWLDKHGIY